MPEVSNPSPDPFLKERYDQLWAQSSKRIRSGTIEIDPVLAQGQPDRRRGMTLLFRPSPRVREQIAKCLEEVRQLEPDQHYYHPGELHVTFLSLFSASADHEAIFDRTDKFIAAVASCVRALNPFPLSFFGITASPAAIMVQSFTDATRLNAARDRLRDELCARGLSEGARERYRLEVAHMTALRFRHPLRNGIAFAQALEKMRNRNFGQTEIDSLELVKSDWYMSRAITQPLYVFQLGEP